MKNTAKLQKAWSKNRDRMTQPHLDVAHRLIHEELQHKQLISTVQILVYQIQIRSIITDTLDVEMSQISIIVTVYSPPYSFCDDKCLTFYMIRLRLCGLFPWDFPRDLIWFPHPLIIKQSA
ncbi:MAG: hypothetical protein IPO48_09140 [Saprospiraceae bacterium]|nr:hypothetical protein [Saprospiraceae bacterium]